MILIADGGSTKVDWILLNKNKEEVFRVRSLGMNPALLLKEKLESRIKNISQIVEIKDRINEIHFYGAGCGTTKAIEALKNVFQSVFTNAKVTISEDMLAAVYSCIEEKPAIVCILGTGSNSCYYDGNTINSIAPSLGYTVMDEASGNYLGNSYLEITIIKKCLKT